MREPKYPIKRVESGKEKGLSFSENFKRYNKAKDLGFYFECLWILYAMLEDRASAFLYYLGFTKSNDRNSVTGSRKIKSQIRQIFNMTGSKVQYKFNNLYGKITRICDVIKWRNSVQDEITDYQKAVKKAIEGFSKNQDFLDALKYLEDEWRDKRNQLVHALFNKDPQAVILELQPLVEQGYNAVRKLDNAVKQLKRSKIREQFKMR